MKIYQYEELQKLNQALVSFKKNETPVLKVDTVVADNKVLFFVLTDPKFEAKVKKEEKKGLSLPDKLKLSQLNVVNEEKKKENEEKKK